MHSSCRWAASFNPVRSSNPYPESVVLRIEPHPKGEMFTLDHVDGQGREHNLRRRPVSRREAQGFGTPRLRGIVILAPIGWPDRGNSAQLREWRVDAVSSDAWRWK